MVVLVLIRMHTNADVINMTTAVVIFSASEDRQLEPPPPIAHPHMFPSLFSPSLLSTPEQTPASSKLGTPTPTNQAKLHHRKEQENGTTASLTHSRPNNPPSHTPKPAAAIPLRYPTRPLGRPSSQCHRAPLRKTGVRAGIRPAGAAAHSMRDVPSAVVYGRVVKRYHWRFYKSSSYRGG